MKTLDLQVDKAKVSFLKQRIDWCQYGTVKRYVETPGTEINGALIVDSSVCLEHVAAVAWSGDMPQWKHLITTGVIQPATDDIPSDTGCHVIYMPPAYLVQLIE